jgi:hypothetical protein
MMTVVAFDALAPRIAFHGVQTEPAAVLIQLGALKLKDIAIYAQTLKSGQYLRVVSDRPTLGAEPEPFCAANGLAIVLVSEDASAADPVSLTTFVTLRWPDALSGEAWQR